MAIQPLDTRLDSMIQQDQVSPMGADPNAWQQATPDSSPDLQSDQQTFEPQQVAGAPTEIIRQILKKAPRRTEVPLIDKTKEVEKVGPYTVIKEATEQKADQILQAAPTMPSTGKPSPSWKEKQAGVPETVTSLDNIIGEAELKQHIEATGRAYGADKLTRVSYKDIAAKAAEDGYDEAFIARIIDPMVKTVADPKEAYKMLLTIADTGKRAFDLGEQVKAAKAAGTLTPELAAEFKQAIAVEGVLLKAARGRQADIARTLGIFRTAREATAERGAMLESILNEAGGIESVFDLANKYTALDSRSGRAALAEKAIGGTLKDIWFTTWINGMLASPISHLKNISGNLVFPAWQVLERLTAAGIGTARNAMFGGEKAIQLNEVQAQAIGMLQGFREGGSIAWKAFVKNEPTDAFTKIESARAGRDPFDIDMGDSLIGKSLSNGLQYYGKFVTLPGRALMAEDEFFKAVSYRMELNALATRETNKVYDDLISKGISPANAEIHARKLMSDILTDPPADIDSAAKSAARTATFTRELEPALQEVQKMVSNNPLLKIFFPFVRTPTNIAMEAMSRTPGLNFASPRFWADFNGGGIRRDMALARVSLGSGLIYAVSGTSLSGGLTGYGPMRKEDRKALEATGWQPFSFVFNKSEVDPALIEEYKKITNVSVGSDKYYISYAALEPLSSLLAIGGTMSEYAQMNGKMGDMDKMMIGGTLGLYEYLADQPMLRGFSELMSAFSSKAKDAPGLLYNIMEKASKQIGTFLIGGSPIGVHQSMVAAIERIVDPTVSNVMPGTMESRHEITEGAMRGFWEAVNYYKSRNPLTSDSLPRELDSITGIARSVGKGNLYEMFNPFKYSDGKMSPAHATLIEYGIPQHIPDKKMDGVTLSASQYNRWIELAANNGLLEQAIVRVGASPGVKKMALVDLASAQTIIQSEITNAYGIAKEKLLLEDRDLADAIKDVKEAQKDEGKFKR